MKNLLKLHLYYISIPFLLSSVSVMHKSWINCIQKIIPITCCIFIGLFFSSCGKKKVENTGKGVPKGATIVEIYVAKIAPVSEVIEAGGTLLANESAELRPETAGRITQLNINEGAFVSKGTLLLKLFDDDLKANLSRLKSEEEIALAQEKRQKELLKIQGISQAEYDIIFNQINTIKSEIDIINAQLRKTEIRAPFDGFIGMRNVSIGSYISPTDIVSRIVDSRKIKIDFSIPEQYQANINKGDSIQFRVNGLKDKYNAVVYAIDPTINPETRNINVRAIFDNSKKSLSPGTFATVNYNVVNRANSIVIPSQAVIPEARRQKVVKIKGGLAQFEDIETGYRDKDNVEVISGVESGDTIVLTGIMSLRAGMPVKPNLKNEKIIE